MSWVALLLEKLFGSKWYPLSPTNAYEQIAYERGFRYFRFKRWFRGKEYLIPPPEHRNCKCSVKPS